jgi:tetratricopeptide (TPR) repeat protein
MIRTVALMALLGAMSWAQIPAQPSDPLAEPGFQHFYNLEYPEALAAFRAEVVRNPNSPDAYNHVAQTVLYREMFRSGALESELVTGSNPFLRRAGLNPSQADEQEFQDSINRAMMLAEVRLRTNPNDIAALYAQGVSYGLRGNYKFLVRKAYSDALRDAAAARKAHFRVTEIDPRFDDARLVQGAYDYVIGSLPPAWRLFGFFAGFRGDRERGVNSLKLVAKRGRLNRIDAEILLCAIYRRERRAQEAVPLLSDLIARFPQNFLLRLELVQMYGDLGEKQKALAVIGDIDRLKRGKTPGYERLPEEKLRYTRGNLLFWYDDLDLALEDLKAVTANSAAVDLNTNLYAWLRTGQIYDLQKKREEAKRAYMETVAISPGSDVASLAKNYLSSRYKR